MTPKSARADSFGTFLKTMEAHRVSSEGQSSEDPALEKFRLLRLLEGHDAVPVKAWMGTCDMSFSRFSTVLQALQAAGLVRIYEVDGEDYATLTEMGAKFVALSNV